MRTITIERASTFSGTVKSKNKASESGIEDLGRGVYSQATLDKREVIEERMLVGIEDEFRKNGIPQKIKELSDTIEYKDIIKSVSKVKFYTSTQEYDMPFLREAVFDYHFYKKAEYIRHLYSRPRGRVLNPDLYMALPVTPFGMNNRYFMEDRMTNFSNKKNGEICQSHLDEMGNEYNPIDFISSFLDKGNGGQFDFILHPFFFSIDEESKERLITLTIKAIYIWSTFFNETILGADKDVFTPHALMYLSQEGRAPENIKREYYLLLGYLRTLHTRKEHYHRICGVDDYLFLRKVRSIGYLKNKRVVQRVKIKRPLRNERSPHDIAANGWFIATTTYIINYMTRLLHFIILELIRDDPAFIFMEKWFQEFKENPTEKTTALFRKDYSKRQHPYRKSVGKLSTAPFRGVPSKVTPFGYKRYNFFLTDEGIWNDDSLLYERTSASYGQFLIPVEMKTLEEYFKAPSYLTLAQLFLDEADEVSTVSFTSLQYKFRQIQKLKEIVVKEEESYFSGVRDLLPPTYLTNSDVFDRVTV